VPVGLVDDGAVERQDVERDEGERRPPMTRPDPSEHTVEVTRAALTRDKFAVEDDRRPDEVGERCEFGKPLSQVMPATGPHPHLAVDRDDDAPAVELRFQHPLASERSPGVRRGEHRLEWHPHAADPARPKPFPVRARGARGERAAPRGGPLSGGDASSAGCHQPVARHPDGRTRPSMGSREGRGGGERASPKVALSLYLGVAVPPAVEALVRRSVGVSVRYETTFLHSPSALPPTTSGVPVESPNCTWGELPKQIMFRPTVFVVSSLASGSANVLP